MATNPDLEFVTLGEAAWLIALGPTNAETTRLARRLAEAFRAAAVPGVYDVVPAYRTVLVRFDPLTTDGDTVRARVAALARDPRAHGDTTPALVELPVIYGGEDGPDLGDVARHTGLTMAEVVRRHTEATYTVEFLGFSPGFPYLSGLPAALATPRLPAPRTLVPAGSVGIAGSQTGFYPLPSPGGWRLIGRIPTLDFDPARPETLPYMPGDRIRFVPVSRDRARSIAQARRAETAGDGVPSSADTDPASRVGERRHDDAPEGPALRVLRAGALSTVQDIGRYGYASLGYASTGALDRDALVLANRLVGNDAGAATVEMTHFGCEVEAIGDLVFAVTGANMEPTIDGQPIEMGRATALRSGMRLALGQARRGIRGYLAAAGGILTPPVLGSRSTDLLARIGGLQGRALRAGDQVPLAPRGAASAFTHHQYHCNEKFASDTAPATSDEHDLAARVTWGPQAGWFDVDARATFLGAAYLVSPRSDRMGLRLSGAALQGAGWGELASEGSVPGVVQVPPDGQPIVLLADSRGVGGYAKIATVIEADLPLLGQLSPGNRIRFVLVSVAAALQATRDAAARRAGTELEAVPELAVQCLIEGRDGQRESWLCPRSRACLVSRRCNAQGPRETARTEREVESGGD